MFRLPSVTRQAIVFFLFSVSAGLIQTVSFTLLNELLWQSYWPSYLTALLLSVLWNFTLNRRYTFRSAANVPRAMLKVLGYYCLFTPLTTVAGNCCVNTFGINEYIVLISTMVLNLVTEFLFCKFIVYKGQENTR